MYGSQARNEARPDSDWGILILLDKPKIEVEDYDNISYPLVGLGLAMASPISKEEPHHERGSGKPYSGVPLLIMQGGFLLLIGYTGEMHTKEKKGVGPGGGR